MVEAFDLKSSSLFADEPTLDLAFVQRIREVQNKQWAAEMYTTHHLGQQLT